MPSSYFYLLAVSLILGFCAVVILIRKSSKESTYKMDDTILNPKESKFTSEQDELIENTEEPSIILEEAITLALEDGKLSKGEELMLREKARMVGKDPDELIQQLREDLFGLEGEESFSFDPDLNPGLAFERYVFQLLNPRYFRLDHWAGDKFLAGRYTSTHLDPDIQVTANTVEGRFPIAVECKWRAKQEGDYIRFAEDKQLERYQEFSKETGKPTFIVLGLGGTPQAPEEVFLIPIHVFKRGSQHRASLVHYRKPNPEVGFFFDPESGTLM
ncbi:hypothetical protein [Algoriphagus litoralis]|uniref:hypothetical protein n=1 Tax=Algoriphagus litoralis TaxID=2202829 RepID=UPI000DBA5054|nr:hypothetical protein [Algoriphagus litoralis]